MELIYVKATMLRTLDPIPEDGSKDQYGMDAQVTGYFSETFVEFYSLPVVPLMGRKRTLECFCEKLKHGCEGTAWKPFTTELTRNQWHAEINERDRQIKELIW